MKNLLSVVLMVLSFLLFVGLTVVLVYFIIHVWIWIIGGIGALFSKKQLKVNINDPRWDDVSERLNCPIPSSIKRFFKNKKLMESKSICIMNPKTKEKLYVAGFYCVVSGGNDLEEIPKTSLEIANDGSECRYFVVLKRKLEKNYPVYINDFDQPYNFRKVANSLEEFSRWPRKKWDGIFE